MLSLSNSVCHPELSTARHTLFRTEVTISLGARHFQSAGHLALVMLVRIKVSPSVLVGSVATEGSR